MMEKLFAHEPARQPFRDQPRVGDAGRLIARANVWACGISDPEQKIGRPRQLYVGQTRREYVPVGKRS